MKITDPNSSAWTLAMLVSIFLIITGIIRLKTPYNKDDSENK